MIHYIRNSVYPSFCPSSPSRCIPNAPFIKNILGVLPCEEQYHLQLTIQLTPPQPQAQTHAGAICRAVLWLSLYVEWREKTSNKPQLSVVLIFSHLRQRGEGNNVFWLNAQPWYWFSTELHHGNTFTLLSNDTRLPVCIHVSASGSSRRLLFKRVSVACNRLSPSHFHG